MPEDKLENDVLNRVAMDRRDFVKKVVIGTAFAVPVVASFGMDSLTMTTAYAQGGNQTSIVRVVP